MSRALFAYGTLQLPEVMRAVTGRLPRGRPARLEGWACYRLRGRPYPGLRPRPGATTQGLLYEGLTPGDWARLDAYEDGCYQRQILPVAAAEGGWQEAAVYVIRPGSYGLLTSEAWSAEAFRQRHLEDFLVRWGLK